MSATAKDLIISKSPPSPKKPLPAQVPPAWQNAKALVTDVVKQSTLPLEWETWLRANPHLSKDFFKQLQGLGEGDSLAFTKAVQVSTGKSTTNGSVTTEWSHNNKALQLSISGDLQHGLAASEKQTSLGQWGEAQAQAGAWIGFAEKVKFSFAHPQDLETVLQNSKLTAAEILQFTQNPILFSIEKFASSQKNSQQPSNPSLSSHVTAFELSAQLTAEAAAKLQMAAPQSSKNSLLLTAQAELGGSIAAHARIEWDENQTPYFVYQENMSVELQTEMAAQVQALKSLNISLDKNSYYQVAAKLQNEHRLQLPKDLNVRTLTKDSLMHHLTTAAESFTQTETLTLNVEKPVWNKQNTTSIEGQELTFQKSFSLANSTESAHLSFSDLMNAFTGNLPPDHITNYNKTQESKSTDIKILGQGLSLEQSTTFTDIL